MNVLLAEVPVILGSFSGMSKEFLSWSSKVSLAGMAYIKIGLKLTWYKGFFLKAGTYFTKYPVNTLVHHKA